MTILVSNKETLAWGFKMVLASDLIGSVYHGPDLRLMRKKPRLDRWRVGLSARIQETVLYVPNIPIRNGSVFF